MIAEIDAKEAAASQNAEVIALIDRYQALLDRKDAIKEAETENNSAIEDLRKKLTDAMVEAEMDGVIHNGVSWTLKSVTRYSKRGGMDEELFEMLRANGLGDIIKETVNAQTLQGAMSELASENEGELPEEWNDCINTFSYMDVGHRKVTNKKK